MVNSHRINYQCPLPVWATAVLTPSLQVLPSPALCSLPAVDLTSYSLPVMSPKHVLPEPLGGNSQYGARCPTLSPMFAELWFCMTREQSSILRSCRGCRSCVSSGHGDRPQWAPWHTGEFSWILVSVAMSKSLQLSLFMGCSNIIQEHHLASKCNIKTLMAYWFAPKHKLLSFLASSLEWRTTAHPMPRLACRQLSAV